MAHDKDLRIIVTHEVVPDLESRLRRAARILLNLPSREERNNGDHDEAEAPSIEASGEAADALLGLGAGSSSRPGTR